MLNLVSGDRYGGWVGRWKRVCYRARIWGQGESEPELSGQTWLI